MLMRHRKFLGICFVLLAISLVVASFLSSPTLQQCVSDNRRQIGEKEQEKGLANFLASTEHISFQCVGAFTDVNSAAITAVATIFIAAFTLTLWLTTGRQLEHNRVVERAYITMSHITPIFDPSRDSNAFRIRDDGAALVRIEFKNYGRTPAEVIGGRFKLEHIRENEEPPVQPIYTGQGSVRFDVAYFLVANADFIFDFGFELPFPIGALVSVEKGSDRLWLVGYVDYRDKFGDVHRAGYARRYDPHITGNNLTFVTEPGYNYDHPRLPWKAEA
jgi:hypothetical protein